MQVQGATRSAEALIGGSHQSPSGTVRLSASCGKAVLFRVVDETPVAVRPVRVFDFLARQYGDVINRMGFEPRGSGGPGCLFHWVAETADGIRMTDVWETKEDFEKFAEEKIGPIQAAGIQGQPETTHCDVHNYLTAG
jgi:hypothetical protein